MSVSRCADVVSEVVEEVLPSDVDLGEHPAHVRPPMLALGISSMPARVSSDLCTLTCTPRRSVSRTINRAITRARKTCTRISWSVSLKRIRLLNSSFSKASQAFAVVRKMSRSPGSRSPASDGEITRESQQGFKMAAISATAFSLDLRVFPLARRAASALSCWQAFESVCSKPQSCLARRYSDWVTTMRRSTPNTTLLVSKAVSPGRRVAARCRVRSGITVAPAVAASMSAALPR